FFFFHVTATTDIYTLSLHDALPISLIHNISSTDYLRLKNVMLSYTIPNTLVSKMKLNNIRVYVSGQNLALWTKYTGYDPDVTTKDRKSTRLNSSHVKISYAVFCLKK